MDDYFGEKGIQKFKKKKPSTHSHTVGNRPVWRGGRAC